ncbi:MAG TPA: hypothetical protein VKW77_08755, partial [Acidimicrobiales bacterium]|nr:hypothetical protein [Acidimicrobiales bacterium]
STVRRPVRRRTPADRRTSPRARALAFAAGAVVAAVALATDVQALAPNLPVTMQPVRVPRWFTTAAPRLPSGVVLATYPFATASWQASIPWQAVAGMPFEMAGGGGPPGTPERAGPDEKGFGVLLLASAPDVPPPDLDLANLSAVRRALRDWQVTMVVVPDGDGLPQFATGRGTAYGITFFTAVLGTPPRRQPGAWVWSAVDRSSAPPVPLPPSRQAACTGAPSPATPGADPWSTCVIASGRAG